MRDPRSYSSSEVHIYMLITDNFYRFIWHQRLEHFPADQLFITLILGIDHQCRLSQFGLRPGSGYYHFPDYVHDLDCVVESLGVPSINLVGHSMGGTISFLYAGTFSQRVRKLVLVEGIGPPGMAFPDAPLRMEKFLSEMKAIREGTTMDFASFEYPSVEGAAERFHKVNPRLDPERALQLTRWGMRRTDNEKWVWKFDPLHRTTSPQPFYAEQAIEFYRRIECPVLVILGKESRQTRRPDVQRRLDAIRDRRRVDIDRAGHMVHQDNPEALAEVVMAFLS